MAKRKPNGEYTGLAGGLVLYEMNGKGIMRGKSKKRIDKSDQLKEVRSEFGVVVEAIKTLKPILTFGFKDHTRNRSAYHSALSINLSNYYEALRLNNTDNYGWLTISHGKLSGAAEVSATKLADGKIEIKWMGTEVGKAHFSEDTVLAGIFLNKSKVFILGPHYVLRSAGSIVIDPGPIEEGENADVFLAFRIRENNYKSNSDKNVSASQWAGTITF